MEVDLAAMTAIDCTSPGLHQELAVIYVEATAGRL